MGPSENRESLEKELHFTLNLARETAKLISQIKKSSYKIQQKDKNMGPVTDADLRANQYIISAIKQHFPEDQIISEEAPADFIASFELHKKTWYVDPIDGTKEFIKNSSEWSIMIGLAVHGEAIMGVVYRPETDELYYATKGHGAFKVSDEQTHPIKVDNHFQHLIMTSSRSHPLEKLEKISKVLNISEILPLGSIGLKMGKISEAKAHLYFNFSRRCHLWDLCAPEIILKEAGGVVLHEKNKQTFYNEETLMSSAFVAGFSKEIVEQGLQQFPLH